MIDHETTFRVRYAETDQMGYVYYGNYATFFEVGRVEMLRSMGITYKKLEADGVMLPVLEMSVKYLKPAQYDDELKLVTRLTEMPGVRIHFTYTLYNGAGILICEASTSLVFINKANGRPCVCPQELTDAIKLRIDKGY
jgi:acyl-CoA thioester hydrolase